ncbi:SWIB/MDM2 domain [Arabidopsis thaliana x Arabidopsis arenosa]|uniref:SWIB/MDM2 domain n=1 Tax=Arabidopsis thaliana x Arabidopsis arenosa TaxID=1240361 RepID=A0A8T2AP01_9BRAS|nr:SWIB/MDM2 domain [Arabidopsis thaliana x Arabidopsis arenosa]
MSSVAAMVFRGARSLLAPASRATSSLVSAGSTKKPAAKTKAKAKPKPKAKSDSPAKKTPRSTGLFKVTPVSPVLAQFLGTGETTRTDAIKGIWTYIKSHDLQNPADKREIFCDETLKLIFEGKDKVGFLEISKLLSPHFVKTA